MHPYPSYVSFAAHIHAVRGKLEMQMHALTRLCSYFSVGLHSPTRPRNMYEGYPELHSIRRRGVL